MTKKNYTIIAVIILLLIAGFVWWNSMQTTNQQAPIMPAAVESADTTGAIQKDLADINIGDVEADFTDVDATIKTL